MKKGRRDRGEECTSKKRIRRRKVSSAKKDGQSPGEEWRWQKEGDSTISHPEDIRDPEVKPKLILSYREISRGRKRTLLREFCEGKKKTIAINLVSERYFQGGAFLK